MLTLYTSPGSCALASHITLEEAGAAYRALRVDFRSSQQRSPEYLKLNPKGRVPALATDRGILTETPAILAWLAQSFPAAGLAPLDDPFAFAQVQELNAYLCATVHVAHAHRFRGSRWADEPEALEAMKRKVPQSMTDTMLLVEERLGDGPWAMGAAYTICDPYLFTISGWLEADGADLARLPRVMAHHARMRERPAVQRVLGQLQALPAA